MAQRVKVQYVSFNLSFMWDLKQWEPKKRDFKPKYIE